MRFLPRRGSHRSDPQTHDHQELAGADEEHLAEPGARAGGMHERVSAARQTIRQATEATGPWPSSGRAATRGFLALALAAMACGPAALALAATRPAPTQTVVTPRPVANDQARTEVESVSVQVVDALLSSDRQNTQTLKSLVLQMPDSLVLPDKALASPRTLTVSQASPDAHRKSRWSVTVVALGGQSGAGQAWQVDVEVDPTSGQAKAVRLPALVAMPASASSQGLAAVTVVSSVDPAAVTAFGFVTSMLTGASDLARWTAPGAQFTVVTPTPCAKVTPDRVEVSGTDQPPKPADRQQLAVTVTVTCTLPGGDQANPAARTLQYPMNLTSRGGRWEVTDTPTTPTPTPTPTASHS